MHIFFTPDILETLELPPEESLHCAKVLRMTEGDVVLLADGRGTFYRAELLLVHQKRCKVKILQTTADETRRDYQVHIAMAPTKNTDRIEWFAEKATEIGIDGIHFLKCRYSERKEIKIERIQKIVVSAMKQSQKAYLPTVSEMIDFAAFVRQPFDGQKFIAHCYADQPRNEFSANYTKRDNVLVLIGPEGDFSEAEVALAIENGYTAVSLGKSRLRTETAALVACHTPHLINGM